VIDLSRINRNKDSLVHNAADLAPFLNQPQPDARAICVGAMLSKLFHPFIAECVNEVASGSRERRAAWIGALTERTAIRNWLLFQ
jgi:hypothetical protein